jgi:NAD(P)H-hydrate epimerase
VKLDDLPVVRDVPSVTAAQMAEVDRAAIETLGIAVEMLMENASHQIAAAARALLGGRVAGKRIIGLIGAGNNGGDTAGALRHLVSWGAAAVPAIAVPEARLRSQTRHQVATLHAMMLADFQISHWIDASGGRLPRMDADLILDGLLGYGASGAPRAELAELVEAANANGARILAVDIPSGLDPDTGTAPGAVVRAATTVTLALPKRGLIAAAAAPFVGTLLLADIGIPPVAFFHAHVPVDTHFLFADGELLRVVS